MFYVDASGSLLQYQWQRDDIDLNDDSRLSGTNTSNLTITGVLEEDGGNYTCNVSNVVGSVPSRTAELTVCKLLRMLTLSNFEGVYTYVSSLMPRLLRGRRVDSLPR